MNRTTLVMIRSIGVLLMLASALGWSYAAQKKKPSKAKPRVTSKRPARKPAKTVSPPPTTSVPQIIGSQVDIMTKNGDTLSGEVLDLTAYSIRIRSNRLESTIALDTIASLSFSSATDPPPTRTPVPTAGSPEFARDAMIVIGSFQSVATNLKTGIDYAEFGRQVTELRRAVEKLVSRYAGGENATDLRALSLIVAGLTDYSWSRTIWTLKFGRSNDGTASASDSPALIDAFAAYPDLRAASASGNKYEVEKIIAVLWKKAAEKSDRARALLAPQR